MALEGQCLAVATLLLYKGSCSMFVYVLYRNLNCCSDLNEIWNGSGPQCQEGFWGWTPYPGPVGTGCGVALELRLYNLAKSLQNKSCYAPSF